MSDTDEAQREFIRAWYTWRHTPLPVDTFRSNRTADPAYMVEFALDHLRSYVYALGSAFMEDRKWDYPSLVADQLEQLHGAEADLENGAVPEERRAPYRAYVAATRAVLHRLLARATAGQNRDEIV